MPPASPAGGDPLADLALADLARAPTLLTARVLLDQAGGALREELRRLERLIAHQSDLALSQLDRLIHRAQVGLRLLEGWRVVIAGRPNVGKSRLFNALVGFDRAIVDPAPGTTRDVVSFSTSLGGWPVELADTAGIRAAAGPIESIGIERSQREQGRADLIVLVLDRSLPPHPIDDEFIATRPAAILAGNKSDLPAAWNDDHPRLRSREIVMVSAATGDGLERLIAAVIHRLVPEAPPEGAGVPFRADQVDTLRQVRASLIDGDHEGAVRQLSRMVEGRESAQGPRS
jgi:tRNA modification GTPase